MHEHNIDGETLVGLKKSLTLIEDRINSAELDIQAIVNKKQQLEMSYATLTELINEARSSEVYSSNNSSFEETPGKTESEISAPRGKFDSDYYNADTIRTYSEEEFMNEIKIEIKPDEFKGKKIFDLAVEILRKFDEPLHKKQLATIMTMGGKTSKSEDFPGNVKSVIKKYIAEDSEILVKNGWYFLREWDLSKWGLDQTGKEL